MFRLQADKVSLSVLEKEPLSSGAQNIYLCQFTFSPEWDGLDRTAVFQGSGARKSVLLDETGRCKIPWEVLKRYGSSVLAGVRGTKEGEVILPAIMVGLGIIGLGTPSADAGGPAPTPGIYDQILSQANKASEIAAALREDAARGAFDGSDGKSAYELYVDNGGTLTEDQWLESLKPKNGEDGGYYKPTVSQPDEDTMTLEFVPSREGMPAVPAQAVTLPGGPAGNPGVWTGPEEPPEGYTVWIDPSGDSSVYAYPVLAVPYSAQVELPVNAEVHIGTTEGPLNLTLGERDPAYSAEWVAEITQGGTAYDIILPVVEWVGDAPTFEADTVTQIRLFIKGETLMGVAV